MIGPVLLIGPAEREECRTIAELLEATGQLTLAPHPAAASRMLAAAPPFELVLVAPACRDHFPNHALQRLLRLEPLAEWWVIVGPWLEGETRSGRPWPAGRRFYLDQAIAELRRRMDGPADDLAPAARWVPPTLTPEERWLVDAPAWPQATGRVRICGELPETRRTLASVCAAMGLTTVAHAPEQVLDVDRVDATIYDAVACRERWSSHVERLSIPRPHALVVLVNFPRPEEVRGLLAAGATDVLGKPFRIDDLRSSVLRRWARTGQRADSRG